MCPNRQPHLTKWALKPVCIALGAIFISSLLTGCGRSDQNDTPPAVSPGKAAAAPPAGGAGSPFKVALVMSGSSSDNGWNAGALKALRDVQAQMKLSDADVAFKENAKSPGEQTENLQAFASQKYNLVFGHGEEYQNIALKLERDFPNTTFVISSGAKLGKNTTPIVFKLEDGAYLLGMLAGGMSKTGKIGAVGAQAIPPVKSVFAAFSAGAKSVNPAITVVQPVYTNDWEDVGKAKQATNAVLAQGADIIIQDLDSAAQGVFNAVQESNKSGKAVYALGTNNDQNAAAPDVILASAPIFLSPVFTEIAKSVQAGTFKPSNAPSGMKQGVIGFVLNPKLLDKIPADLKAKIDTAEKQIKDGSLNVPMAGS